MRVESLAFVALSTLSCSCDGSDRVPAEPSAVADDVTAPVSVPGIAEPSGWVGVVVPARAVDVKSEVQGEVLDVRVRVGDHVAAGDLLATIDDKEARDALRQVRARLRSHQAELEAADVTTQHLTTKLAQVRRLAAQGHAPPEAVVDAEYELEHARQARARSAALRAEQEVAAVQVRERIEKTEIRAPFSGLVASRRVEPGDKVAWGTRVVRLISDDTLRLKFAVPAADAAMLEIGDEVEGRIGDEFVAAIVEEVSPEIDPAAQLVVVRARFDVGGDIDGISAGAAVTVTRREDM